MKQQYAFDIGEQAEKYFEGLCSQKGIQLEPIHLWYDYLCGDSKVEVKSCQLITKNNPTRYKTGRWDFTNKEQARQLREDNSWICLLIQHQSQYLIYGLLEGRNLPNARYISIPKARTLETITFEEWTDRIQVPF